MPADTKPTPHLAALLHRTAGAGVYLRTVIGLLACFAVLCAALFLLVMRRGGLPLLPITDNISFNEKARLLRDLPRKHFDIIAAGSSMALNNVSSDAFVEQIPARPTFINIAASQMRISETRLWLRHVIKKFGKPLVVLLCICPEDFRTEVISYEQADSHLDAYLAGRLQTPILIENFSLVGYMKLSLHVKEYRKSRRMYESLDFDRGGGIPLEISYPNVEPVRWNFVTPFDKMTDRQFEELDRLAAEMKSDGIWLICVTPPSRQAIKAREDPIQAKIYQARVAAKLHKNDQILLDLPPEMALDDSNFVDSFHLNAQGARAFSQFLGRAVASTGLWSAPSPSSR